MTSLADGSIETQARQRPRFARGPVPVPLKLPAGKKLGAVIAVALGRDDDMFVLHQPNAQGLDPGQEALHCWLPPLSHFGRDGTFINAWGGDDQLPAADGISQWPRKLEGLEHDLEGNLWIFGFGPGDNVALKFSPTGELLLRIGQCGKTGDDDDTRYLDRPTSCHHDIEAREVFVSDGYGNHRVIAFNSDTGRFTRMWGAYGKQPSSLSPEEGFKTAVHKIARGPNGKFYVADRTGCKIQEFEVASDSVRFTREVLVAPGTMVLTTGSVWDIAFSPDGRFLYVADGANFRIWSIDLDDLTVLGSTSVTSEHENDVNRPVHFTLVHRFAVEKNGDLLLACVNRGLMRLKFLEIR